MVNVNVNLKVPALEKLLDYAASGIGAVAGPMLASWKARKQAEARLIGARAEADSLTLIADARSEARRLLIEPDSAVSGMLAVGQDGGITQRIEFQEQKRQANIVAVVQDAATELGDKEVPEREPDPDWTARFFDCVQDVSSEDMRALWARILAGEVDSPGRTTLKTLDVLKNMTREDAELFNLVCDYVIQDFVFHPRDAQDIPTFLRPVDVMQLQDADLLHASTALAKAIQFDKEHSAYFVHHNYFLRITSLDNRDISIPAIPLTRSGKEVFLVLGGKFCRKYLQSFSNFLYKEKCGLFYARIVETRPSDGAVNHEEFIPIEPMPRLQDSPES